MDHHVLNELLLAGGGTVAAACALVVAIKKKAQPVRSGVVFSRKIMAATTPKTQVFAKGSLTVTSSGEIIIDEVLPSNKAILTDPDTYITVEFDPTQPAPAPCAGGLPDECGWELFFTHVHDTFLNPGKPAEQLKLKIEWRVATARLVNWQILVPVS